MEKFTYSITTGYRDGSLFEASVQRAMKESLGQIFPRFSILVLLSSSIHNICIQGSSGHPASSLLNGSPKSFRGYFVSAFKE